VLVMTLILAINTNAVDCWKDSFCVIIKYMVRVRRKTNSNAEVNFVVRHRPLRGMK